MKNRNKTSRTTTKVNKGSNENTGGLNVDLMISKLLEVRGHRPDKEVNLTEKNIHQLCNKCPRHIYGAANLN